MGLVAHAHSGVLLLEERAAQLGIDLRLRLLVGRLIFGLFLRDRLLVVRGEGGQPLRIKGGLLLLDDLLLLDSPGVVPALDDDQGDELFCLRAQVLDHGDLLAFLDFHAAVFFLQGIKIAALLGLSDILAGH